MNDGILYKNVCTKLDVDIMSLRSSGITTAMHVSRNVQCTLCNSVKYLCHSKIIQIFGGFHSKSNIYFKYLEGYA